MPKLEIIGPTIEIKRSCFHCTQCRSIPKTHDADEPMHAYCMASEARRIPSPTYDTPDWCPALDQAIRAQLPNALADLFCRNKIPPRQFPPARAA